MEEFFEVVRKVLVPMFYKESMVAFSVGRKKPKFKKKLFRSIMRLSKKADRGELNNADIRKEIAKVAEKSHVSFGQAQKVINVYLKYYCILTHKPMRVIKELDCPLDSKIMSDVNGPQQFSLKAMECKEDYEAWQDYLKGKGSGVRLRPDIEAYDKRRIESFKRGI